MSDTTNHDLHFNSENRTNELADGELDERDLEAINGGVRFHLEIPGESLTLPMTSTSVNSPDRIKRISPLQRIPR